MGSFFGGFFLEKCFFRLGNAGFLPFAVEVKMLTSENTAGSGGVPVKPAQATDLRVLPQSICSSSPERVMHA